MKQILFHKSVIGWLGLWLILCGGCERNYLTYNPKEKGVVYVQYHEQDRDTLRQYFDALDVMDSIQVSSEIFVMGMPVDYDRVVDVSIVDSLTTAEEYVHFSLGKVVIKAGEVAGEIPWTLYRTRDPELANHPVLVGFRLNANEYFNLMLGRDTCIYYYQVRMATVDRPNYWDEAYLGPYSEKLYGAFLNQYLELEHTHPSVYKILTDTYSYKFEDAQQTWNLWTRHEYMVVKYIVHPLYDYYQANPAPDVDIPTPKY